jgi:hypothetical protein
MSTHNMAIQDHYGRDIPEDSAYDVPIAWRGGAASGFFATVASTLVIVPVDVEFLSQGIAGMYGLEGLLAAGVAAHLVHGTLFGVVFAAVLSDPGLVGITHWLWKTVFAGLVFGLVLAVVGTGFVLPAWLQFVGLAELVSMPYVTSALLGWHALYGLVLGAVFPFLAAEL